MERDQVLHILKALADGVDPVSGEQFADDGPYQRPSTVRALYCAIQLLENSESPAGVSPSQGAAQTQPADKPGTPRPERTRANAGRPWSTAEETQLSQAFDSGRTIAELAQVHQRSRWAIEARLAKLGKIPEPPAGLRFPVRPPTAAEPRAAYAGTR
jgi:hypothetical protein